MSSEEHCIINLISKVQYIGWQNIPDEDTPEFFKFFREFRNEWEQDIMPQSISYETFKWLVRMAQYVVYGSTVKDSTFCNIHDDEDNSRNNEDEIFI